MIICELCKKEFAYQSQIDKHYSSQKACIPTKEVLNIIRELKKQKKETITNNSPVINVNGNGNVIGTVNVNLNTYVDINENIDFQTNINLNSLDSPDIRGLDLLSPIFKSEGISTIINIFKRIYFNDHIPTNKCCFLPRFKDNKVKFFQDRAIKVLDLDTFICNIEGIIYNLCLSEIQRCPINSKFKPIIRDDLDDIFSHLSEVHDHEYYSEEKKKYYDTIKGLLYANKTTNSLKKHISNNISRGSSSFVLDKRIVSDETIIACDKKINQNCLDVYSDKSLTESMNEEDITEQIRFFLQHIRRTVDNYSGSLDVCVERFNQQFRDYTVDRESLLRYFSAHSDDNILDYTTRRRPALLSLKVD